jgi:hypothetical protein
VAKSSQRATAEVLNAIYEQRFLAELRVRFGQFGLQLHADKITSFIIHDRERFGDLLYCLGIMYTTGARPSDSERRASRRNFRDPFVIR